MNQEQIEKLLAEVSAIRWLLKLILWILAALLGASIALLCEADAEKTNWQDILRRANSALEHLQSAQGKE